MFQIKVVPNQILFILKLYYVMQKLYKQRNLEFRKLQKFVLMEILLRSHRIGMNIFLI